MVVEGSVRGLHYASTITYKLSQSTTNQVMRYPSLKISKYTHSLESRNQSAKYFTTVQCKYILPDVGEKCSRSVRLCD